MWWKWNLEKKKLLVQCLKRTLTAEKIVGKSATVKTSDVFAFSSIRNKSAVQGLVREGHLKSCLTF